MVSYRKRANGWEFRISYKDECGKYKQFPKGGYRTKAEASLAAAEYELKLSNNVFEDNKLTFYDYYIQWFHLYKEKEVAERTKATYLVNAKRIDEVFKNIKLRDMTPAIYQNGLNTLGKRLAKETLVKFHHHCKSSLKYAIHEGLISKNFAELAKVSSTSDTEMDEKKKYLELDEYKSLLRKLRVLVKYKRYLFLYVLAVSGLRYAEGKALNKNTIDFENNVFIVKNAWNDQTKTIGQLKNIHSERRVPFNNTTKRMLQYYFRMHPEDKKFFTTLQNRDMNNLLKSLVGRDVHLHTLRHTYVSYLASEKVDVNTIARLVGHKDATTTLKKYTHLFSESQSKDFDKVNDVFNSI